VIGIRASRRMAISEPVLRQLAVGVRASKRRVGYLGADAALTVLNSNDPIPVGWTAHWDTGALIVTGNSAVIDHYRINASVIFTGNNPTMTNCVIHSNSGDIFGVTINGAGHGVLNISDTTVVGNPSSGTAQVNGISSDSGLVARRCDVSQTGDGIHMVSQPNANNAIISQCYVHDQAFVDEAQHCDGIQIFNDTATPGFFTVEHCYIARTLSTIGTPLNSAMTCGQPTDDGTALITAIINNNHFDSGLYHLRVNFRLHNITVTNNDCGPLYTAEFGTWDMEVPVATWAGNKNADGSTEANPFPLLTPILKESLQTTDNNTAGQTLSTTAGTTLAGDTILVIQATDNNTVAAPTSTAGTLTQIGSTIVDGNNSGVLRAYTVPVATSGSKNVVIPAASSFDVYGMVFVLGGEVEVEGFTSTNFPSSVTSFSTPAATLAGSKDLLVAFMLNLQGAAFDLSSSGLTQHANPQALPFSATAMGTAALGAAGTSPTYTISTGATATKAAVGVFGIQRLR
jgi:hypothetical protein